MKTHCPLCGEKEHDGPCYADLREEWRDKDVDELFAQLPPHFLHLLEFPSLLTNSEQK